MLISDTDMYSFIEKGRNLLIEFVPLLNLVKQIINTWNHMMIVSQVNISCIWMQIIFMVRQWVNIWFLIDLNG